MRANITNISADVVTTKTIKQYVELEPADGVFGMEWRVELEEGDPHAKDDLHALGLNPGERMEELSIEGDQVFVTFDKNGKVRQAFFS